MKPHKLITNQLFRLIYLSSLCGNLYLLFYAITHESINIIVRFCIILIAILNLWITTLYYKLNHEKKVDEENMDFKE
jgi:lipid-A-disaccharide synthase-like uncharacterized protein